MIPEDGRETWVRDWSRLGHRPLMKLLFPFGGLVVSCRKRRGSSPSPPFLLLASSVVVDKLTWASGQELPPASYRYLAGPWSCGQMDLPRGIAHLHHYAERERQSKHGISCV